MVYTKFAFLPFILCIIGIVILKQVKKKTDIC